MKKKPRDLLPESYFKSEEDFEGHLAEFVVYVLRLPMWSKLLEICDALDHNRKVVVKGCHASGKTLGAAAIFLAFFLSRTFRIGISSAPTNRQVRDLLWSYINQLHGNSAFSFGGTMLQQRYDIADRYFAVGFTARENSVESFQGYHSKDGLIYMLDEATGVPRSYFDVIDRIVVTSIDRFLALCNPDDAPSACRDCFSDASFVQITISAFDTPNVDDECWIFDMHAHEWKTAREIRAERGLDADEEIFPGMVSKAYVEEKRARWGEDSVLWKTRILAQFADQSTSATLIPLSWWEHSVRKWYSLKPKFDEGGFDNDPRDVGVDVARYGNDETVFSPHRGIFFEELQIELNQDTMKTAGQCKIYSKIGYRPVPDEIAVGSGVVDRLLEDNIEIFSYAGSRRSTSTDRSGAITFPITRDEAFWTLREDLDPKNEDSIALPDDPILMEELVNMPFTILSGGKIKVELKDHTKKRLGRSPNRADAVVMSNFARKQAAVQVVRISQPETHRTKKKFNSVKTIFGG